LTVVSNCLRLQIQSIQAHAAHDRLGPEAFILAAGRR